MKRCRKNEIPFSFDSFLDVVANVCGIIIRLILVAWVGARSYSSIQKLVQERSTPQAVEASESAELKPPPELLDEIARHRRELESARQNLLDQMRKLEVAESNRAPLEAGLASIQGELRQVELLADAADREPLHFETEQANTSMEDLRRRRQRLLDEIRAIERQPRSVHALRYQTPVSRPVRAEEFMFECSGGRVTFIDLRTLEAEIRHDLDEKGAELRSRWETQGATAPAGAFRLRYTVERERGLADNAGPAGSPVSSDGYRYGLSQWVVEPVSELRGENLAAALGAQSEFRRITDVLDPRQAVVTFWVYPDSFELFRRLRDHLYERDLVVAGRPLPVGAPIAGSRHGSVSRGQ
jgi:hypothetical protein